ncbi:hypothetical protein QEH59_10200 [Coraliomargarita sp. SDUM461004]|uniref:Uncharacterized protein n=1 Tax=Thalassobacterium sedimentorum TaxID=3041258 RepID=A0ABU1AMG2_9BACT|nr:hypothetical protein [Coraliomargarita sp. SDUM461004]MDQ8194798.1 hypothetical protein [Coraliomargarita sp. SDUM461004]
MVKSFLSLCPLCRVLFVLWVCGVLCVNAETHVENWSYQGERGTLSIEPRTGQLVHWKVGDKLLIDSVDLSNPLEFSLMDGRLGIFRVSRTERVGERRLHVEGAISVFGQDPVPMSIEYSVNSGGDEISIFFAYGVIEDLPSTLSWQLPLNLKPRKRIFYLSDYALPWESRYFYQFTYEPRRNISSVPTIPDRNIWRYFALDQMGESGYRLWKSESHDTAPLIMHEGRVAAPVVQVFDHEGGLSVTYPDLVQSRGGSIRVDAAMGGEVQVSFLSDEIIPAEHELQMGPSTTQKLVLKGYASEDGVLIGRAELTSQYQDTFSEQPSIADVLGESPWLLDAPLADSQSITAGYPFPQGKLKDVSRVGVLVGGEPVAIQASPLAWWPDGSLKWVLLSFPFDASKAVDDCEPPRISLRNQQYLPVSIQVMQRPQEVSKVKHGTFTAELNNDVVHVRNGDLELTLGTGEDWLRGLSWQGEALVDASQSESRAVAYSDFVVDTDVIFPFSSTPKGATIDQGVLVVEHIELEEAGPLRAVVKLEGLTTNREPMRITLRFTLMAGVSEIQLSHTALFRFKDPRNTFLTGLGIDLPLASTMVQTEATEQIQLLQLATYHREKRIDHSVFSEPSDQPGYLQIRGKESGLVASIRNFREQGAKALTLDVADNRLKIELWPELAPLLDMRRYSNLSHRGQLESAPATNDDWVRGVFYETDPVYGIARSHDILLAFDTGEQACEDVMSAAGIAADFQSPPLLYAGWQYYGDEAQVVLPSAAQEEAPHSWQAWTNLATFYLFHQKLHAWYSFWNYGDVRHRFAHGYGWMYSGDILASLLDKSREDNAEVRNHRKLAYRSPNDWNYDNGAYGWTNTEGLPGLFLHYEYLRHGNRAMYFAAEAMARYARDVIIRHEGRWLGTGTRHGVQPWSDGNHQERQTVATEYRLNYLLSGDPRSRDVIENLYQNVYTHGVVDRAEAHSGRLSGLLFHWELTGDPAEAEVLKKYVHTFLGEDGIYNAPSVKFPEAEVIAPPEYLNHGSIFFHTFGAMHSLIEYQAMTQDPELHESLIASAYDLIQAPSLVEDRELAYRDFSYGLLAYAAKHAVDPEPYREVYRAFMEEYGWVKGYQFVTANPEHWTGDTRMIRGSVSHGFFWVNWAPYFTWATGNNEVWTPKIENEIQKVEMSGTRDKPARLEWQTDYNDYPAIIEFISWQWPWLHEDDFDDADVE